MSFFKKREPVSFSQRKKAVKKSAKKSKPTIVVSGVALQLAKRFVEFVMSLPTDDSRKRRKPQYNKWAEQLQQFIDSSDYGHVQIQIVFEWYTLHYRELWKIESPNSFTKYFKQLAKRYEYSINPYTSQQLKPVMLWLLRLYWKCSDKELELVVGRSLWRVQQLLDKCNDDKFVSGQNALFFKIITDRIGNSFDFVQSYFEKWFWEHDNTECIKIAEITKKRIFRMIQIWLTEYGIENEIIEQFILVFDCLEEISFCS